MFEAGVVAHFDAQHVMHGMEGPEGVLHSHDYRIDVTARRATLDELGMVVDLDILQGAVEDVVDRVKGRNLDDVIVPRDTESVTVEALALWIHHQVSHAIATSGVEDLHVRAWETDAAFGGYAAAP
ncbi:MAG: 6-carboxytetrahydropterin synthase [Actinobacteria bacterium]|nr:6-carboxytetrahydropterin synthase [Actinomycetota bacterium]